MISVFTAFIVTCIILQLNASKESTPKLNFNKELPCWFENFPESGKLTVLVEFQKHSSYEDCCKSRKLKTILKNSYTNQQIDELIRWYYEPTQKRTSRLGDEEYITTGIIVESGDVTPTNKEIKIQDNVKNEDFEEDIKSTITEIEIEEKSENENLLDDIINSDRSSNVSLQRGIRIRSGRMMSDSTVIESEVDENNEGENIVPEIIEDNQKNTNSSVKKVQFFDGENFKRLSLPENIRPLSDDNLGQEETLSEMSIITEEHTDLITEDITAMGTPRFAHENFDIVGESNLVVGESRFTKYANDFKNEKQFIMLEDLKNNVYIFERGYGGKYLLIQYNSNKSEKLQEFVGIDSDYRPNDNTLRIHLSNMQFGALHHFTKITILFSAYLQLFSHIHDSFHEFNINLSLFDLTPFKFTQFLKYGFTFYEKHNFEYIDFKIPNYLRKIKDETLNEEQKDVIYKINFYKESNLNLEEEEFDKTISELIKQWEFNKSRNINPEKEDFKIRYLIDKIFYDIPFPVAMTYKKNYFQTLVQQTEQFEKTITELDKK